MWRFAAPNAPPTDLVVFNETTTTLNARWNPPPGRVQNYKITYVPTSGGRSQTVSPENNRFNTTHLWCHLNASKYSSLLEFSLVFNCQTDWIMASTQSVNFFLQIMPKAMLSPRNVCIATLVPAVLHYFSLF